MQLPSLPFASLGWIQIYSKKYDWPATKTKRGFGGSLSASPIASRTSTRRQQVWPLSELRAGSGAEIPASPNGIPKTIAAMAVVITELNLSKKHQQILAASLGVSSCAPPGGSCTKSQSASRLEVRRPSRGSDRRIEGRPKSRSPPLRAAFPLARIPLWLPQSGLPRSPGADTPRL